MREVSYLLLFLNFYYRIFPTNTEVTSIMNPYVLFTFSNSYKHSGSFVSSVLLLAAQHSASFLPLPECFQAAIS